MCPCSTRRCALAASASGNSAAMGTFSSAFRIGTIQTFKFASPDFGVVCNDFEATAFSGSRINAVRIRKPASRA